MAPPVRGAAALEDSELETFKAPQYFDFTSEASARLQQYSTSSIQSDPDDILFGEQFVPGKEGISIFRAHEMLVEYPEAQGIVRWLDGLRKNAGKKLSNVDIDLTNGIALVDAMSIISKESLNGKQVKRDFVRPSSVADYNITLLREALTNFVWHDELRGENVQTPVDFSELSPWSLAGFVLAAAVNCPNKDEFIQDLMQFDVQSQELLDSTVQRAYKALGISYSSEDLMASSPVSATTQRHTSIDRDGFRPCSNDPRSEDPREGSNVKSGPKSTLAAEIKQLKEELSNALDTIKSEKQEKEVLKAQACDLEEEVTEWKEHTKSLEKLATDMTEKSQKAKEEIKKQKVQNQSLTKKLEAARKEFTELKRCHASSFASSPSALKMKENSAELGQSTIVKRLMNEKHDLIEKAANERRENAKLRRQVREMERRMEIAEREVDRLQKLEMRASRRIGSSTLIGKKSFKK